MIDVALERERDKEDLEISGVNGLGQEGLERCGVDLCLQGSKR
jgi:hypothetical protein